MSITCPFKLKALLNGVNIHYETFHTVLLQAAAAGRINTDVRRPLVAWSQLLVLNHSVSFQRDEFDVLGSGVMIACSLD